MAALYEGSNDFHSAYIALMSSRNYIKDLLRGCMIHTSTAGLCFRFGQVTEAVNLQKSAYKMMKDLMEEDDERLISTKKHLEQYIRAYSEMSVVHRQLEATGQSAAMNFTAQETDKALLDNTPEEEDDDVTKDSKDKPKKKRSNHKKSSKGKK
jgi:hypothetical protein